MGKITEQMVLLENDSRKRKRDIDERKKIDFQNKVENLRELGQSQESF